MLKVDIRCIVCSFFLFSVSLSIFFSLSVVNTDISTWRIEEASVSTTHTSHTACNHTSSNFDSALSRVVSLTLEDSSGSDKNVERRQFNLKTWDKKTTGGLFDLDRLKLSAIYRNASSVFEWGLGESSFIAAEVGVPRYVGIDSDPIWIKSARDQSPDHFRFHLGDTGPTKEWGRPIKPNLKKSYLNYQFEPLLSEKAFDVYMVDGRMRPGCALVAFLHASGRGETEQEKSPTVIVHDYYDDLRSKNCRNCNNWKWQIGFHKLEEVADLVDHSGAMLAVFKRKAGISDDDIQALWEKIGLSST